MNNILEWIDTNLQSAILEKDNIKISLYREIKTYTKNYMVENKLSTITQKDIQVVFKRILKVIQEEIGLYSQIVEDKDGKLNTLYKQEEILKGFLPKPLSKEDMENICKKLIEENPSQNIGFYMSKLKDIEGIDKGFCSSYIKNNI